MGFREGTDPESETIKLEDPDAEDTKVSLEEPEADESDKDEDEPEEKAAKGEDGQPRKKDGTWAAKKAERAKDRKAAKAWETERADYDRRLSQVREESDRNVRGLREELDRLRQQGQGQGSDPFASALSGLDKQLDQELKLIEADANHGYGRYRELNDERNRVIARMEYARLRAEDAKNAPQRGPYDSRVPIIESEFPWTADRQYAQLAQKAMAYRNYLIQVEGRPDTIETDREALATTQSRFGAEFGLRPPPAAPSQRTRSLYAPPPSRGTPNRQPPPREVDLGVLGQGTGLSPDKLAKAVRAAFNDE